MKQLSLKKFLALSLTFLLAISLFLTPVVARAEESRTLISYLNDFLQEQDMGEWLEKSQELMGQEVDLTIDLGPGMLMEADIAQALASLGLQIKYQADLYNSGAMAYNFLLYNKEEPANSLSLSLNILGENLLVDLPGILDKPISMSGDDAMDMASMFGPMPSAGGGVMALPEAISQNIEQAKVDFLAAKDNFLSKFDDLGESSSNFVVGELNEDLTVQSCSLAAADMEVAVLDFLQEIRASQALTAITDQIPVNVDDLSILSAPAMSAGGGEMEGEASSYEDEDFYDEDEDFYFEDEDFYFDDDYDYYDDYYDTATISLTEMIDQLIAEVEADEMIPLDIQWDTYMSATGEKRGFKVAMSNPDTENKDKLVVESVVVKSPDQLQTGILYVLQANNDSALFRFELNDFQDPNAASSSGSFTVDTYDFPDMLNATYQDVKVVKLADQPELLLGQFDVSIKTVDLVPVYVEEEFEEDLEDDDDPYYNVKMVDEEKNSQITIKSFLEADTHMIDIDILPDIRLEDQYVSLHLLPRYLSPEEVNLMVELPEDYYDLNNEEDLAALEENEDLAMKLMEALSNLGLLGDEMYEFE